MYCSPSAFVFILSASLFFNCLHFGVSAVIDGSGNDGGNGGGKSGPARLRIDITRKHSVQLNGVEIDENSLVHHLKDHERELIFGKSKAQRRVKLVHLRHRTDAAAAAEEEETEAAKEASQLGTAARRTEQAPAPPHRVKRADNAATAATAAAAADRHSGAQPSQEVSLQIRDNENLVNLQLRQSPQLIDDAFIFIRRYANSTQFIEDSHKLAAKYERCFYSNENSALDLCDDENVRGVFHHNATDFIIHPLPSRFGNSTHVILESVARNKPRTGELRDAIQQPPSPAMTSDTAENFDSNFQFEPNEEDFNELSIMRLASDTDVATNIEVETMRPTRNINHSNYNSKMQQATPLKLRYKPRYQHAEQHQQQQQQQQHHHLKHHQQKHRKHQKHHNHQNHHQQKQHQQKHHIQQKHHLQHNRHDDDFVVVDDDAHHKSRQRRYVSSGSKAKIPQVLHIETAIFVDNDLFYEFAKNFPKNTQSHLIRFVLAMINGVQLLYHHPSLGRRVNFVLKRLEILYEEPKGLRKDNDIDKYLSNFCMWQKSLNPVSDEDSVHYDHAVILTGLDLFVEDKNGKKITQVVGLAPVAGMCTQTSSCTINEGKHFESVFVVAHEIGHNLGMRHDVTTNENSCDSTRYIMSPTLGSGKITWSECSRAYLDAFLEKDQAQCLFDRGQFKNNLDHAAEGILPGERFDANQQCMLKYGKNSVRAKSQNESDICRDLHCQRDRYTWTSHPALEGTECGSNRWCHAGICVIRPTIAEPYNALKQIPNSSKLGYERGNSFVESSKMGHLLHEHNNYNTQQAYLPRGNQAGSEDDIYNKHSTWGTWGEASECDSGCLYGPSKRLGEGSTGLKFYTRSCHQRRCLGRDRKFESCKAKQCYQVPTMTIEEFATQICEKAQKSDPELTGVGQQIVGDIEESCKVMCKTKSNGTKQRRWTFPDGTTCRSKLYNYDDTSYCIAGRCEKFSCDNSTHNFYKIDPIICQYQRQPPPSSVDREIENRRANSYNNNIQSRYAERESSYNSNNNRDNRIYGPTTVRSKYENEVAVRSFHGQQQQQQQYDKPFKLKSDPYQSWNKYNYHLNEQQQAVVPPPASPVSASLVAATPESEWLVKSGCHSSCMLKSKGVQVVTSRRNGANNIQLCTHAIKPCERLLTPAEYAESTCGRYKLKVRGLSGRGTQIAASIDEPDRSCRVGCQDEVIKYRFYLVNGKYGHFPLGTKCSNTEERYCVNGKCLEFGADSIPLQQSHISLALLRSRRDAGSEAQSSEEATFKVNRRQKRSYLYYEPVNITETLTQEFINDIVNSIMNNEERPVADDLISHDHIEFTNPIHISTDELSMQ